MHHMGWSPKPISCRVDIFKAQDQTAGRYYDEYYGWGGLVNEEAKVRIVPGDHLNFISRHTKDLARSLNVCLVEVQKADIG